MRCKRCKERIVGEHNSDGVRLFMTDENGFAASACAAAPEDSQYPWHIPSFPAGPNFDIPKFDRHFLAADCHFCGDQHEIEYTKSRGTGGPLPEEHIAEEMRDVWIMTHVLGKHPAHAK